MLYHLFKYLDEVYDLPGSGMFQYISFRAAASIILALLMMFAVIRDPNSQMAFWFSVIPFTSPIVMIVRIPYDIPLWEIALSLAVLYASFVGMVWFAAKIYRVGIFMYGKKPTLGELFKWVRYKY